MGTTDPNSGLACSGCGYSLKGIPGNRCPECGGEFDPEKPGSLVRGLFDSDDFDWLLILSIITGLIQYGFRSHSDLYEILWAGTVWCPCFAWIAIRRHDIFGRKPYLALWVIAVAVVAQYRPNMSATAGQWLSGFSLVLATASILYAAVASPRTAARGILLTVSAVAWFVGAVFAFGVVASQLGVFANGRFAIGRATLNAGGLNDAIVAGVAIVFGITAETTRRMARRFRDPSDQTT
jgi:hypothetical protein